MPARRMLALKREVLQELGHADLNAVVGGTRTVLDPTGASCLDYISCWPWQCLLRDTLICPE